MRDGFKRVLCTIHQSKCSLFNYTFHLKALFQSSSVCNIEMIGSNLIASQQLSTWSRLGITQLDDACLLLYSHSGWHREEKKHTSF